MLFVKKSSPVVPTANGEKPLHLIPSSARKKGVIPLAGACSAFRYDPLKRVPPRPVTPDFCHLDGKDFTL